MSDIPRKTLTITRKPANGTADAAAPNTISRTGKRIIRRDDLANIQQPGQRKTNPSGKAGNKKKQLRNQPPRKPVTRPSELKARELNDRLNGFPVWLNYQPLALGVEKEIFRLVSDEHFPGASKHVVQKVLRMHTSHGRYLETTILGKERFRLDGTTDGSVTDEQQTYAQATLAARKQQNHD